MNAQSPFFSDWVAEHAERTPDAPAVDTPHQRLTYGELQARVRDLAGHLADRGVQRDDRVIVAVPTSTASVVAALAVHSLGACVVEIDRAMGQRGFRTVLTQAQPRYAVVAAQDAKEWSEAQRGKAFHWAWVLQPRQTRTGFDKLSPNGDKPTGFDKLSPNGEKPGNFDKVSATGPDALGWTPFFTDGTLPEDARGLPAPARTPGEIDAQALVLYTSGSTGTPRGVIQTYRNLDANSRSIVECLKLTPSDRVMAILPFYYCYGRSLLQTHMLAGGSVFYDARFMYPRVVMEAIGSEGCTGFAGVPLTFEILRREVDLTTVAMPKLRYLTQAGGPMRPDTVSWVRKAFAPAQLYVMYGQTEATARLAYLPPERAQEKLGSFGIAIPGVELQVVDEHAREVAVGEVGHLVARGDNVTPGYLCAPEETAAILHDGWLWTGDLAKRDADGYFFMAGRAKEIIKVAGFRVSPLEIEQVLMLHPDVKQVAVLGAPDPVQGEVAIAFVVPRPGATPEEQDLRRFCKDRLAPYKVPSRVALLDAIPCTESGKPLKAELAGRARAIAATGVRA